MTRLSRRSVLLGAAALMVAAQAQANAWVEVTGSAVIHNAADIDAARRRALADALLSAAFAGGASVQGHSVMSMARMTSDLLIVRPVGRVLRHEIIGQRQSGDHWQVSIRALVGQPMPDFCEARRSLVLTVYPPDIRVSANAPAWADALAQQIAVELVLALIPRATRPRGGRLPVGRTGLKQAGMVCGCPSRLPHRTGA